MTKLRSHHIELDGQGFVVRGAPGGSPAYQSSPAPLYENRFAQGDRSFGDFQDWWYWAQDIFNGGISPGRLWADDGKISIGLGIDAQTIPSSFLSGTELITAYDDADNLNLYAEADGKLFGRNVTDDKMTIRGATIGVVYEGAVGSGQEKIYCAAKDFINKYEFFGCHTNGGGASTLKRLEGSTVTDVGTESARIYAMCRQAPWVWYADSALAIKKVDCDTNTITAVTTLPAGAWNNWCTLATEGGSNYFEYGDGYLFAVSNDKTVWAYDIANDTWSKAFNVTGTLMGIKFFNGKLYFWKRNIFNNLVIGAYTPSTGIVEEVMNLGIGSSVLGSYSQISKGGEDYLYFPVRYAPSTSIWGTDAGVAVLLRMDSSENFEPICNLAPAVGTFSGPAQTWVYSSGATLSIMVHDRAGAGENQLHTGGTSEKMPSPYIITGWQDGGLPSINKYWNDILMYFNTLGHGTQVIKVSYRTSEADQFVDVSPSISQSTYGNINEGSLVLNVTSKKIQLKITLTEPTLSTWQTVFDSFVVRYLPMPNLNKRWDITILCSENIELPDGSMEDKRGASLRAKLDTLYLSSKKVVFKDYDYCASELDGAITKTQPATTNSNSEAAGNDVEMEVASVTGFFEGCEIHIDDGDSSEYCLVSDITGSTLTLKRMVYGHTSSKAITNSSIKVINAYEFPDQDILRVEDELILYEKTATGMIHRVTRGFKGTLAIAHADDIAVDNSRRVVVSSVSSVIPVMGTKDKTEYFATVNLRELS